MGYSTRVQACNTNMVQSWHWRLHSYKQLAYNQRKADPELHKTGLRDNIEKKVISNIKKCHNTDNKFGRKSCRPVKKD